MRARRPHLRLAKSDRAPGRAVKEGVLLKARMSAGQVGRWIGLASLAVALLAAAAGPASAVAKGGVPENATIYIKGNSPNTLRFVGPKKVREGGQLTIVNQTDPRKVGPQTFSLVEPEEVPKTKSQRAQCPKQGHICNAIMHWHGIKSSGQAAHRFVDTGFKGWDALGSKTEKGDSWYTNKKGQSIEETVFAGATATPVVLTFISAFDPELHGSITVVPFQ